jgi:translocation and assembly module TamB
LNTFLHPEYPDQEPDKPQLVHKQQKKRRRSVRRILGWTAGTVAIILAILIIAVVTLPHLRFFRQYALKIAENKLDAALGTQVEIRDFRLSVWRLQLDLDGIVVEGANPYPNPPLLAVDHIGAAIGISSLFHGEWYLRRLAVDHPVAYVFVDAQGRDNLPQSKSSNGQSHASIFRLGVRHAVLDRGEVFYNNRKNALDADLHDLEFHAGFAPGEQRYSGQISYRNGHLRAQNFNPVPHDLNAEFEATPSKFTLKRSTLNSGKSRIQLTATVENYADPRIEAKYSAVIDSGELRRVMNDPSLPEGLISANGGLSYQSQPKVPMLESVRLNGDIGSSGLLVQTANFKGDVTDIGAHVALANGDAAITGIHARLLGGTVAATLFVQDITNRMQSRMHAEARGISLAEIRPLTNSASLREISLAGTLNSDADATWQKKLDNLIAHANVNIAAGVSSSTDRHANQFPVSGIIHAEYISTKKQISLQQSNLRLSQTSLNFNGAISDHSSLQVRVQANDLHELQAIAEMLDPALEKQAAQADLRGMATFIGTVSGSTSAPELRGHLAATNLKLRGTSWPHLQTGILLNPAKGSLQNGELRPADGGSITFNASVGLRRWSFDQNSPIDFGLVARQINVGDLTKLAGTQAPVEGLLSANISLKGSESAPTGKGSISLSKAKIGNEQVQLAAATFQSVNDALDAKVNVRIPAGEAQGTISYSPRTQNYQAQLQATNIRLDQLQTLKARNMPIEGILNITAKGAGNIKNPAFDADIESPKLVVRNQALGDLKVQASLLNHVAQVAVNAHAVNTLINAKATVHTTGDYQADANVDTQTIPLQPLIAAYAPAEGANVAGQTELHLKLHGPLKEKSALEAHATISVLQLSYTDKFHLAAVSPIHADLSHGVLLLQKTNLRGTDTDVQLEAKVPMDSTARASLLAQGTVNLEIAKLFDPDVTSSGEMRFDINSFGARTNPDVQGQIHITNANFTSNSAPIGLQNGNGTLTLTKDRLNINDFSGTVGGGKIQASGAIVYKPAVRFDLGLSGKGIRLLYPEGVRESLSPNLTLTGTMEAASLGGQVRINQLSFTPDFDLTGFMSQFTGDIAPPPTGGFAQNLQLNVSVQSTNGINLVSRELSLDGNANLNIRGTADDPVILGRVNLNSGDLIFMGNRYLLQAGTIDFANASQTLPVLNVSASTTIQQYDIRLQFNGPADHLRTNYTSVPSLPPSDIINLLVFGQTAEESAANPMPGNLGAESLIASQISSQVTSRVEKIAGISRLSIDPVLAGNGSQQNPGARITIQQRVTGNIFVTFSTDVTGTENQVIELQYNASPRVTFSGTRDQNGGFGFDTRIKKTW